VNSQLILAAGAVCLVAMVGTVRAQSGPQQATPSAQPATMQNAETPVQPVSYGGVPATTSATGKMSPSTCTPRPQCDVFFGN
jgi:energy-converting hydrogenase Eha subunit F